MTVSTLTVVPETIRVSGAAPSAEPTYSQLAAFRPITVRDQVIHRTSQPDYFDWQHHIRGAAGCTSPIRLVGEIHTVAVNKAAGTGLILSTVSTQDMPDGAIYKPCGNRRATACPSCADTYRRDAYQLIRAGMVGGKGVPASVATHPAVFATFTAPSFGPVHTRAVVRHTCESRARCDCRPAPCRPNREQPTCAHGVEVFCYARHESGDSRLGRPLCLDCYDHDGQVVWNMAAGELWRRTTIATTRTIRRVAKAHGIDPKTVKVAYGKVAEMQRRGVMHFHAIIRLDGTNPDDPAVILPPPARLGVVDLVDAVTQAAQTVAFTTDPHHHHLDGWTIAWGAQVDVRPITVTGDGEITDGMVAGYLAKYATKSTEDTGHLSRRLDSDTISVYANPTGSHVERLIHACWHLGARDPRLSLLDQNQRPYRRLRKWAHMLGFGGHFLTKSRYYSVTFGMLRDARTVWRRTETMTAGPTVVEGEETIQVVNLLQFVGAGWKTNGDAILANSAAARAREYARVAREETAYTLAA